MKKYILFLPLLLMTSGCFFQPHKAMHNLFTHQNFTTQDRFQDLTLQTRELTQHEIAQIFMFPQELEEQYRVVHLQVSNNAGYAYTVCPLGTSLATSYDTQRYIDPSNNPYLSIFDVASVAVALGVPLFSILAGVRINEQSFFITLLGVSVFSALAKNVAFNSDAYKTVQPYLMFRDADTNPVLTINPYQDHHRIVFISRAIESNVVRFAVSGGKYQAQEHISIELVPPL